MAAIAITCTPTAPTAAADFCRIDVTNADENTLVGYDPAVYPSSPEVRYYLAFSEGRTEYGRSPEFSTSHDGKWQFNSYMFPHAGSWTVTLFTTADVSKATQAVTVA